MVTTNGGPLRAPDTSVVFAPSTITIAVGETATINYSSGTAAPSASTLDTLLGGIATTEVDGGGIVGAIVISGVSAGTASIAPSTPLGNGATMSQDGFTLTVTAPVDDDKFLNKRGLTHFWENIDEIKQDKLTAGTNITIASDNTISASQPTVNDATLTIQRNGTNVQTFTANASSNVTANISVPTKTSDLTNDGSDNTAQYLETDETAYKTASIPYGQCDGTSTSTVFTATVPGVTELRDGVCMWLKNGVVTSASGFTINVNNLGAKPVYSNMSAASAEGTLFNVNYTFMFVYDSSRVAGGCWVLNRGYFSDANSVGYQIRTNSSTLPALQTGYRYRLWLTSADGQHYVPINTATGTSTTSTKALNTTTPIDPFGTIVYNSTNATVNANANLPNGTQWTQYVLDMRYAKYPLTLTYPDPVYLKCTPQTSGSGALINDIVQALPTTEDGKIYIYLGNAYSETNMELKQDHPVYYFKDGAIREWTNPVSAVEPFVIHVTSVDEANQTFTSTETYEEVKAAYDDGRFLTLEADMSNSSFDVTIHADLYQYISTTGTEGFTFVAYDASSDTQRVGLSKMAFDMYKDSNGPTYEYNYYRSNGIVEIDATLNQYSSHAIANSAVATALATKADSSSLATVATSGSYNDLSNKPTIPVVNNATLTIQKNGTSVGTFTANASANVTANITVPTQTSDLTNNSGFLTSSTAVTSFNGSTGAITYTAPVTSVNGSTGAITGLQTTSNLVTSVSGSSTDSQYPSAKLFYDTIGNVETILQTLNNGGGAQ